jgi:thiol-disulfide isomerase/thioredoxin
VILQPDGKPASGADVGLQGVYTPHVTNGQFMSGALDATKADDQGHFQLPPPREGPARVFAVHSSGWGEWLVPGDGTTSPVLKMRKWATIEGTVVEGGKPLAGKIVRIEVYFTETEPIRASFRYQTKSDKSGHFAFDRVVDGPAELQVEMAREAPNYDVINAYTARLELQPGQSRIINFGGTGKPVIGKLSISDNLRGKIQMPRYGTLSRVRPTFVAPPGYEQMSKEQKQKLVDEFLHTPAYQDYVTLPTGYGVRVQPNGSFRANDITGGQYLLAFRVYADQANAHGAHPLLASMTIPVTVPEMPEKSNEPLDVSEILPKLRSPTGISPLELEEFKDVKVSDNAPAFRALTLDGKPVKLADLRGKFVVLDFWATWCPACIADMPKIAKLHETYKNDPKVAVVGISLDDEIDLPARFAKNRSLPWTQWYGGASGPQSAYNEFLIHASPSVYIFFF